MIGYLADIYPDELISSCLCRTYKHSGYCSCIGFGKEIFKKKNECIDYFLFNNLKNYLKAMINAKQIIHQNTLIPYYTLSLGSKKKEVYVKALKFNREAIKHLAIPKINNRFLKYCTFCYQEDKKLHGEPYFHRIHQVVEVCPYHNCRLNRCSIISHKNKSASFKTLDDIEIKNTKQLVLKDNDINVVYSKFVLEVLNQEIKFSKESLSNYLRKVTPIRYYVDKSLCMINSKKLFSEMKSFYKNFYDFDLTKYRVCSIYNGTQLNVRSYLLIAFFLGLSPIQVSNIKPIKRENRFVNKTIKLYKEHHSIQKVSILTGVDKRIIRRIVRSNS